MKIVAKTNRRGSQGNEKLAQQLRELEKALETERNEKETLRAEVFFPPVTLLKMKSWNK